MALTVRHSTVVVRPDDASSDVGSDEWNADHTVSGFAETRLITDVLSSGATGGGTVDDTSAIQDAIDTVAAAGGGTVYFPAGIYKISSTLNVNNSNIALIGDGADSYHDGGTGAEPATTFLWAGGASPMVKFATIYSASASKIGACAMRKILLDGNAVATQGLYVDTIGNSIFDHLVVKDVVTAAYHITCGITGTNTAEAADTQGCLFRNCLWRLIDSAPVQGAHGMHLDGSTNANTSFNRFEFLLGQTKNGNGLNIVTADNNLFTHFRNFISGGGTGKDIVLFGYDGAGKFADGNVFLDCSWFAGGCVIKGTESGFTQGSTANQFYSVNSGNGADFPSLGTGCRCVAIKETGSSMGITAGDRVFTSAGTYTVNPEDEAIVFNAACTVTLPNAATFPRRWLKFKTITNATVISATGNVQPLAGGANGTAILAATAGRWASLQSDGSNWIIMAAN